MTGCSLSSSSKRDACASLALFATGFVNFIAGAAGAYAKRDAYVG